MSHIARFSIAALVLSIILPVPVLALSVEVGSPPPPVTVSKAGELEVDGDEIAYQPWNSNDLTGRMRVVQHLAGRSSARKLTEPLTAAITAASFAEDAYQTTTIIDKSDALFGTGGVVSGRAESSKKEFPWSSVVLDEEGTVRDAWGLEKKTATILVVDQKGTVLKTHVGELSSAQIDEIIGMIKAGL
jgi:YtfJ family uncharacterized protein